MIWILIAFFTQKLYFKISDYEKIVELLNEKLPDKVIPITYD